MVARGGGGNFELSDAVAGHCGYRAFASLQGSNKEVRTGGVIIFIMSLEIIHDKNVSHLAFSSNAVKLTTLEGDRVGDGTVKIPGAMIGALISCTEILYGISFTDLT